jgi:hypothetical protein
LIGVILERWGDYYMEYIFYHGGSFVNCWVFFFCNARFTKVKGGDVSRTPIISFGDGIQIKFTAKNWSSFFPLPLEVHVLNHLFLCTCL